MLWKRLKRAATALCLSGFVCSGQARAYQLPDGVDPATVLIGHVIVDSYDGFQEPTPVYADQIDQDGIYTVPDGSVFLPGTTDRYAWTRAIATSLAAQELPTDERDALVEAAAIAAAAEFKVASGAYDTSAMIYFDMTPLHEAAVAAAPSGIAFLLGLTVPPGPRLVVKDSFDAFVESIIQAGGDLYGLRPDDPGLLEIMTILPSFEPADDPDDPPPSNAAPTADAGADRTVASGEPVTLDGTASSDPDAGDTLTHAWTQTAGPEVTLSDATAAEPGFTAPAVAANDPAAELAFSLVVTDDKGNTSAADTVTITVSAAAPGPTPGSEFETHREEVRAVVTGLGLAELNGAIASNERMLREARQRLIVPRAEDVPFRIDPRFTGTDTILSASGAFFGLESGADGRGRRLVVGDFSLRRDERTGATTATLTARAAWERMVSGRTLLGAFIGGEFAQSDLIAPREGAHQRAGVTLGGYGVHEIRPGLYADGFLTFGAGRNALEMAIGEIELDGDHASGILTVGAALGGQIDRGAYQVLPEVSLSYGRVRIGGVALTGRTSGLTDKTLRLAGGEVSRAAITFTPEVRFTADGTPVSRSRAVFSLAPRLTCQALHALTVMEACGGGLEIGFTGRSRDGLSTLTARAGAERILGRTVTTLQLGANIRF